MMNYAYVVVSHYDDAEITVKTNDPETAVLSFVENDMKGVRVEAINGYTGEVFAHVNGFDRWGQREWWLMVLGAIAKLQAEAEAEEEQEDEIPSLDDMMKSMMENLPLLFSQDPHTYSPAGLLTRGNE